MAALGTPERLAEIEEAACQNESRVVQEIEVATAEGPALVLVVDIDGTDDVRDIGEGHLARLLDAQADRLEAIVGDVEVVRLAARLVAVIRGASRSALLERYSSLEGAVVAALSSPVAHHGEELSAGVHVWREILEDPADVAGVSARVTDRLAFNRWQQQRNLTRALAAAETFDELAGAIVAVAIRNGLDAISVRQEGGNAHARAGVGHGPADVSVRVGTHAVFAIDAWLPDALWSRTEAEHLVRASATATEAAIDRVAALEAIRHAAEHDELTGTLNRAGLHRALSSLGDPFVVAIADLDHLKRINDERGHAAGDAAIRRMAALLTAGTRGTDLVARWGGEEFVVILRGASVEGGSEWLQRILDGVADGDQVTFSAGVSQCPDVESFGAALAAADSALYRAKRDGRGRIYIAR